MNWSGMARDIRNIRTEQAIADAFLEELANKPLADIKVSSVAQRAGISRSTFYAHFSNTRDVFDLVLVEFMGNVRELGVHLQCAACGKASPGAESKLPFCIALRSAGRYEALVRSPEFLPSYLAQMDVDLQYGVMKELVNGGVRQDVAKNVMRFQLSGCYAVAMSTPADSDWSLTQAALDTYIGGGIERLKRTPKHITGHLTSS